MIANIGAFEVGVSIIDYVSSKSSQHVMQLHDGSFQIVHIKIRAKWLYEHVS